VFDFVHFQLAEDANSISTFNLLIVHVFSVRPDNILCDGENQRLRLTNFGNAVDLDPPRVGLDNDSLEIKAPGSIANTLAADIFSGAVIVCQLLFDVSDEVLNQQLKDAGYNLDMWLQKKLAEDELSQLVLGYLRGVSFILRIIHISSLCDDSL